MKFGYDNLNMNIMHQISHHKINGDRDTSPHQFLKFSKLKMFHKTGIMFCLILIEILAVIMISGCYLSPLNRIAKVSVNGNRTVMSRSILSDMKAGPGNSVTRLLSHQADFEKSAFNKNPQLKSIKVFLHHWNHVMIKVKEYPIVAYLNYGHRYFAVLSNGKRSYQDTRPNQINPVLVNFKSSQKMESFIKYYRRVPDIIKPDINQIYFSPTSIDPDRIKVRMNDGNWVYANFKTWSYKMRYYSAISRSMRRKGIINVELGTYSKAFTKSNHKQ